MTRLRRSHEELTLGEVVQYYETSQQSILALKDSILKGTIHIPDHLIGLTHEELNEEIDSYLLELDLLASFTLLSATEASLKIDFDQRVNRRWKDKLSRRFLEIYDEKKDKVSLEKDILQEWKEYKPQLKHVFSNLIGAFKYRHWLAHGRYWVANLPRQFDFTTVHIVCDEVEQVLRSS